MKTNFEHLQSLNVRSMALAIWNYIGMLRQAFT